VIISEATYGPPSTTAKHSLSIYFSNSSTATLEQFGASSDGFNTTQFPAAIALPTYGIEHKNG